MTREMINAPRVFVVPENGSIIGAYNLLFQDYPPLSGAIMLNIVSSHERPREHYSTGHSLKEDAPEYFTEADPRYELDRILAALDGPVLASGDSQVVVIHYTSIWTRFSSETEVSVLELEE